MVSDPPPVLLFHTEYAQAVPDAPPCDCGATLTDKIPVSGISTRGDKHHAWTGTVLLCQACEAVTDGRVTPRPGHRRRTR